MAVFNSWYLQNSYKAIEKKEKKDEIGSQEKERAMHKGKKKEGFSADGLSMTKETNELQRTVELRDGQIPFQLPNPMNIRRRSRTAHPWR